MTADHVATLPLLNGLLRTSAPLELCPRRYPETSGFLDDKHKTTGEYGNEIKRQLLISKTPHIIDHKVACLAIIRLYTCFVFSPSFRSPKGIFHMINYRRKQMWREWQNTKQKFDFSDRTHELYTSAVLCPTDNIAFLFFFWILANTGFFNFSTFIPQPTMNTVVLAFAMLQKFQIPPSMTDKRACLTSTHCSAIVKKRTLQTFA